MNYPYLLLPLPDSGIGVSPIEASGRTRSRDRGKLDRGIGPGRMVLAGFAVTGEDFLPMPESQSELVQRASNLCFFPFHHKSALFLFVA